MDSPEYIKQKYSDLIPRSFKTKLEIFLFERCIVKGDLENITIQEFKHFKIEQDLVFKYQQAWQLEGDQSLQQGGIMMKDIDDMIENWGKEKIKLRNKLYENYKILFITEYFPFSEFENIYDRDPKKRTCHYCQKSDYDLSELREEGKIYTKQIRGYTMEIDRLRPNYEYTQDNVVLACYWCNNAKSDEFSESEFHDHIGPSIQRVWNDRAENSSEVPSRDTSTLN